MRRYAYVAQVFGLLIGFYLMCAALVVGLIVVTVLGFGWLGSNRLTILLLLVTLGAIFVVLRGVFVSTRVRTRHIVGVVVTPAQQPALWARIRQLAAQVGTRAPRRLYLVPDANAAVWENARLLGMIPGKRQMMIGLPLLMAMTPAQLDSVLAHELGHYGNRDTRVGGLVGRTRQSVISALRAAGRKGRFQLPGSDMFVAIFRAYAKVVLRVTQEASRAQEYAADRVAAQIAGPANAIAALSQLRGIDAAFDFYMDRYVAPGLELGLLPPPPEVFGGFLGLRGDSTRQAELDEMRTNPSPRPADPYDSHPPIADRIAALESLPPGHAVPDAPGVRAMSILANPADALAAVAMRALQKHVGGKSAASWDALASANALYRADQRAKPLQDVVARLSGRPADLVLLVEMLRSGWLNQILDALPRNEASQSTNATGRVAREHAKTELARMLEGWVVSHLARTGRATWTHSWADIEGRLQVAPELKTELDAAIDEIVAVRPADARLRTLIYSVAVAA
jgi:Zn-dependent protease with chaperone function